MREILKEHSVLYAEDHIATQKVVVDYLNGYFKKVYVAQDGKEALALYKIFSPSSLILEIDMPYIDGLTLAEKIREENVTIPIVMLTACTDTDKLLRAIELNLLTYLVKPIEPQAFRTALEKIGSKFREETNEAYLRLGDFHLWDKSRQELLYNKVPVELSQKERLLLMLFIEKTQQTVFFEDIMVKLWEDEFETEVSIDSVKKQVSCLRKKLSKNMIRNVYGQGYVMG
jgi:DNA-binding response OmpR family regulator